MIIETGSMFGDPHAAREGAPVCSVGESPSGKAPDFDSGIRRFDPYLPSHNFNEVRRA